MLLPLVFKSHTHPGVVSVQFQPGPPLANSQPFGALLGEPPAKNLLKTDPSGFLARTIRAVGTPLTSFYYINRCPPSVAVGTTPRIFDSGGFVCLGKEPTPFGLCPFPNFLNRVPFADSPSFRTAHRTPFAFVSYSAHRGEPAMAFGTPPWIANPCGSVRPGKEPASLGLCQCPNLLDC